MATEREQTLVDLMFEFVMRLCDGKYPITIRTRDDSGHTFNDREEVGEWMRRNLNASGFPCRAIGSSWASLDRDQAFPLSRPETNSRRLSDMPAEQ